MRCPRQFHESVLVTPEKLDSLAVGHLANPLIHFNLSLYPFSLGGGFGLVTRQTVYDQ